MKDRDVRRACEMLEELARLETTGMAIVRQPSVNAAFVIRGGLGNIIEIPVAETKDLLVGRINRRIRHLQSELHNLGVTFT